MNKNLLPLLVCALVFTFFSQLLPHLGAAPEAGELLVNMGEGVQMSFIRVPPARLWVARCEVTNKQFKRYDATHLSPPFSQNEMDADDQPAVCVSWRQALSYTDWMSRRFGSQIPAGNVFRLPLEREWTIFASCGDNRIYPWGNQWPPPDDWNYRGEEGVLAPLRPLRDGKAVRGHNDGFITTAPVLKSGKNSFGLYGVGGNAWEWCLDIMQGTDGARVLRGASWHNYLENHLRLNYRASADPGATNSMTGFRVVIGLPVNFPQD